MNAQTDYSSPLGKIILTCQDNQLTGLYFDKQKHLPKLKNYPLNNNLSIFTQTKKWLNIYFTGKQPPFIPPILMIGTQFQKQVWQILLNIPFGKTCSYTEITQIIITQSRKNMSAQAVGNAVGKNPISLIIPCHRVIGKNGNLTGYAGGIDKKLYLLQLEQNSLT